MGAREVCFLIGPDESVLWSDASDDPRFMPDSRERWERIWAAREQLVEIAHTHPLGGLHFSATDIENSVGSSNAVATTWRRVSSGRSRMSRPSMRIAPSVTS